MPVLLFENFYDIFYEDSMNFWNGFSDEQKAQSAFVVSQFGHTYTGYTDWPLNIGDSLTPTYNADYVVNFFDSVREGTEPTKVELGKVTYYPVDGERWYSEGYDDHERHDRERTLSQRRQHARHRRRSRRSADVCL